MNQNIRKLLLTLLITATAFTSKAQQPTTPQELNDALVAVMDTLRKAGQEWGAAFQRANATNSFELLKPYRLRIDSLVDEKMKYIYSLNDINNSKQLRLAFLDFLAYEKTMVAVVFARFETLGAISNNEERKKLLKQLSDLANKEKEIEVKMQGVQVRYAKENGLTLEK